MLSAIEKLESKGSGWRLEKLLILDLHINKFSPLIGLSYIPFPEKVANKKAVINIPNTKDEKCLLYGVIAGTYLKDAKLVHAEQQIITKDYEKYFTSEGFPINLDCRDTREGSRNSGILCADRTTIRRFLLKMSLHVEEELSQLLGIIPELLW